MSETTGIGVPDAPDDLLRLIEDLRHLLGRADALGMTLVSIHIENAINCCTEPGDSGSGS